MGVLGRAARRRVRPRAVLAGLALVLVGCSNGGQEPDGAQSPAAETPGVPTSSSAELPTETSLTQPGTELELGERGSAIYSPDGDRTSVLAVTITAVRTGSAEDFTNFALSKAEQRSSIYYVDAALRNAGEQALGGAAVPLYAVDRSGASVPPTNLVGRFKPCAGGGVLPPGFEPTARTRTCLLYLLPRGSRPVAVQMGDADGEIAWSVPADDIQPAAGRDDQRDKSGDKGGDKRGGDRRPGG